MGELNLMPEMDEASLRRFTYRLIEDVRALEYLLEENRFESGVRRIGVEQEMFLVDDRWRPAPVAEEILKRAADDDRVVSELMKFNLELNLDPVVFQGDCLRRMERSVEEAVASIRKVVEETGAHVVLAGILPTITLSDLDLAHMMPAPRYHALNEAIARLRGGPAELQIRGTDELYIKHDSITLEGCNTSFQTHLQVHPDEFAGMYNIAQAVAGPVLAAAVNSPTLFGKRLWQETRIALFQQAVDTRSSNLYIREMSPRVHFGTKWIDRSVLEIFQEDISRFRILLSKSKIEDPMEALGAGRAPKLQALQLYNGTVYRWNRACYGVTDGNPTLRIENRILPSGPTVIDEMANAAFWFGLTMGLSNACPDIRRIMDFDDAVGNFVAAARLGLAAQFTWLDGRRISACELICHELLPLAREGLHEAGIATEDITRYLDIIEERVTSRRTGAHWQLHSLLTMRPKASRAERLSAVVAATVNRQKEGAPVHTWPEAEPQEGIPERRFDRARVEEYMSTDLVTVNEEELVELVACLMDWKHIRHVLVEDNEHRLVGLVSHRNLLRLMAEQRGGGQNLPVKDVMIRDLVTVSPDTLAIEAIHKMRDLKIGSLPVVRDGHLIGIITEKDFIEIAGRILDQGISAVTEEESASPDPELNA